MTHDLRIAIRRLWSAPGFTVTAVLMLAVGIGAATTIFSLVEGILLRPLPFRDSQRLVLLGDHLGASPHTPVTAREIGIYSSATSAFSSMGGYISASYELSGGATPEQVSAARFTAGVFPTLGVHPLLGRVFTREEEDGQQPLAVISYALWLNRYGRDPHVIGKAISLDRKLYAIIGVMPRDFAFPLENGRLDQTQLWIPMSLTPDELSDSHAGFWGYDMVARLQDNVSLSQAAQDADRVAQQVMRGLPASQSQIHIRGDVIPLLDFDVAHVRPLLRTFFLAVSIVLLIACVNVAGLLLVRAIRRRGEYAVRLAMGARSRDIVCQSMVEGLLVGAAAGLIGLSFAAIALRTALNFLPESMPRIDSVTMDATVSTFAVVISVITGALCGLAPAIEALHTNVTDTLKENARTGAGSVGIRWLRSGLVVFEIAVALMLLSFCGALWRSLQKMQAVDPGFRPDHVVVAGYQLPLAQYSTQAAVDNFHQQVVEGLSRKPGISAVGIANFVPATGLTGGSAYTLEGERADAWKLRFALFTTTYGDYFHAMGIRLVDGRYLRPEDRLNSPLVMIVNESMATHSWPGQRAIGQRLHLGSPKKNLPWATVVGVVADAKMGALDEPTEDQWYTPLEQPAILGGNESQGSLTDPDSGYITLRSALPPTQMIQTVRSAVAVVDPLLALQPVQPMDDVVASAEAPRRFNTDLISAFALVAVLLAVTGLYAVVAFSVSLRRQEIAIRMALGAQRSAVAQLVLNSAFRLIVIGCVLGTIGSIAVSRITSAFLFGVSATDPLIYVIAAISMTFMAMLASALPARRAASLEPLEVLRTT